MKMAAAPAGAPKAVPIHVTVSVPQEAPVHAHAPHPHAAGPQAPQAHDYCYGCRKFYTAVTRALGATKILTAVAAAVPMAYLLAVIIGVSTAVESTAALLKPTMAVLTSLTFVFGILAWIAIWAGTQNILAISVWAYYAIGNWALVSIVILVLAGWSYNFTMSMLWALWTSILPPVFIYLFSAAIMDAHRAKITALVDGVGAQPQGQGQHNGAQHGMQHQ